MERITLVHPALPRIGQGITAVLAISAIALGSPWPLLMALALVLLSLAGPRWSPVAWAFRRLARPAAELEPAAPVRFSQTLAAVFLSASIVLGLLGLDLVAWLLAGMVAALAVLSAATGLCVGCEAYRLLLALRRGGDDVREPLGLRGDGPWLVVLTAPGCARCEPVARALEQAANGRPVARVSLRDRPQAAVVPVKSVPAVLVVSADGSVREAHAGALDRAEIARVASSVVPAPIPA